MTQTLAVRQLLGNAVRAYGAMDFDACDEGISPRRLPAWTRPQLPQAVEVMARMPSGVRLQFSTDTTRLGVEFLATARHMVDRPRRPMVFNLETGGCIHSARSDLGNTMIVDPKAARLEFIPGAPDTVWFSDLAPGRKDCELWLPHNAFIELRSLMVEDGAKVAPMTADTRARWIHYGSSISQCAEAEEPAYVWPAVAARRANVAVQNLGLSGQCHLDQFVARTIRDAEADIVSIKTGINIVNMDSMRERVFIPALHGFLDTVREGKPDAPILAVSPIFCPGAETRPGPMMRHASTGKFDAIKGHDEIRNGCMSLRRVREIIAEVVDTRRRSGDEHLYYLDGLTLFEAEDAEDLPDDLHPNAAGYIRIGERFAPTLKRLAGLASR